MSWCVKLQIDTASEARFTRSDNFEANGIRLHSSCTGDMDRGYYKLGGLSDASFAVTANLEVGRPMDWCVKLELDTPKRTTPAKKAPTRRRVAGAV